MKKILSFSVLCFLSFQCTENFKEEFPEPQELTLSTEQIAKVKVLSEKLAYVNAVNSKKPLKQLMTRAHLDGTINDLGQLFTDPAEKEVFDIVLKSDGMQALLGWTGRILEPSNGRGKMMDEYNPEDVMSEPVKYNLGQLRSAMANCIDTYYYETDYLLNLLMNGIVDTFESNFQYDQTLTSDEINSLYISCEALRGTIPDAITTARNAAAEEESKTQINWARFKHKLGSIIAVTIVVGLAGVLIGLTVGAAAPVVVSLAGWYVSFQTAGAVVGTVAGLVMGTGMALSDICFSLQDWDTYPC